MLGISPAPNSASEPSFIANLIVGADRLVSILGLTSATFAYTMTPTTERRRCSKSVFPIRLIPLASTRLRQTWIERHNSEVTRRDDFVSAASGGGRIVGTFNLGIVWVKAVIVP